MRYPSAGTFSIRTMIGQTLGHYRIVNKLGEGGMGVVYLAEDTTLDRQVALKVLPPELAENPERLARFQREAKTLAALHHPNIVTIFSVESSVISRQSSDQSSVISRQSSAGREGEAENWKLKTDDRLGGGAVHFLTMELVQGRTLRQLIETDGMALGRLLELSRPLADALSAAHAKGVVHRDLKPENVMVTKEGQVKILDFGLAKVAQVKGVKSGSQTVTEFMTQIGGVVGTAPYMSPEQVQGRELDHRSDIFSLGVIFYEMATGDHPFSGDSTADIVSSILRDSPKPVSEVRIELPHDVGRIVERCLAKDTAERYQSAGEMRDDLEALEQDLSSGASQRRVRSSSERHRSAEPGRGRRRALAWVGGLAALLLLAALAFLLPRHPESGPDQQARTAYAVAVMPFDNLTGQAESDYMATGISSGLITALSEVSGLRVISRAESWSARERSSSSTVLAKQLGVNALIEGEVQRDADLLLVGVRLSDGATGRVLWSESFEDEAEELFTLQKEIAGTLASVLSIPVSESEKRRLAQDPTQSFQAYDLFLRAQEQLEDRQNADSAYQAAELFRQAIRVDPDFALAHAGLSDALWQAHQFHQDQEALAEAEAEAEKALELDPQLPAAQVALARVFRTTGRYNASIAEIEEILANHPKPDEAQQELAWAYERAGDIDGAERCLRAATALAGDDWFNWNALGTFLGRNGKYEEARQAFEKASAVAPSDVYLPQENLATTDLAAGRFSDAVEAFEQLPPEVVQSRPRLASNIGTAFYFSKRPNRLERAAEYYRLAIRLRPNYALYHRNLADVYQELDRGDEAIAEYREAFRLTGIDLEDDPDNPRLQLDRADFAAKAGACANAMALADDLRPALPDSGPAFHQLAYVYAQCGEDGAAIAAIEKAIALGEPTAVFRLEREFEGLHGNPSFEALFTN